MAQSADEAMVSRKQELIKQELEMFKESYFKCVGKSSVNSWL